MRMIGTLSTKKGRVEVLTNYWVKMLGNMQLKCSEKNDKHMQNIIRKLYAIPKEIQ